jgi:hypothetical protein
MATRVSSGRQLGTGALVVTLAGLATLLPASAAAAHGGQPVPDAAYYRTDLSGVQPSPSGVTARVDPAGEWIELASTGPAEIIILGYTKEPYLRIEGGAVEENQVSPTTFLNRSLFADSLPDEHDSTTLPPVWRQVATNGVARWHDHRIHWMGGDLPPQVRADPSHAHPIGDWVVHATAAGVPFDIRGTLRWIGKPNSSLPPWLWAAEILGIAVLVVGVVAGVRRDRRAETRLTEAQLSLEEPPARPFGSRTRDWMEPSKDSSPPGGGTAHDIGAQVARMPDQMTSE